MGRWQDTTVGRHLISLFNGHNGYKSKAPDNIYWHYWRDEKATYPHAKKYEWKEMALSKIDTVMRTNPYRLAMIHARVKLSTIDDRVINLPPNDPWHVDRASTIRLRALIDVIMDRYWNDGREILPFEEVDKAVYDLFSESLKDRMSESEIRKLYCQRRRRVMKNHGTKDPAPLVLVPGVTDSKGHACVMGQHYFTIVNDLAEALKSQADQPTVNIGVKMLSSVFGQTQSTLNFTLSEEQRDCVLGMLAHSLSLVTGYAGTGKTTMLRAVVKYIESTGQDMMLTAISGKACSNLLEKTQTHAGNVMTIAKLRILKKQHNKRLEHLDYLIIDEISMVDEATLLDLLEVLPDGAHLIMLGDRAQLPAVGGVGVLTSLKTWSLLDHQYPHGFFYHELTHVYRQAKNSLLDAATAVRSEQSLTHFKNSELDKSLYYKGNVDISKVTSRIYPAVAKYFNLDVDDITILSPTNKVVNQFDEELQAQLIDTKCNLSVPLRGRKGPKSDRWSFAVGDKVLVTSNMYGVDAINVESANLFNGLIGTVVGCYPKGGSDWSEKQDSMYSQPHLVVRFDTGSGVPETTIVPMMDFDSPSGSVFRDNHDGNYADLQNVQLGYALTIHKAQGSTMKTVIVYVANGKSFLMDTRELLYTALTRAHDRVIFVSDAPINTSFFESFIKRSVYDNKLTYLPIAMESGMTSEAYSNDDYLSWTLDRMSMASGEK